MTPAIAALIQHPFFLLALACRARAKVKATGGGMNKIVHQIEIMMPGGKTMGGNKDKIEDRVHGL